MDERDRFQEFSNSKKDAHLRMKNNFLNEISCKYFFLNKNPKLILLCTDLKKEISDLKDEVSDLKNDNSNLKNEIEGNFSVFIFFNF